MVLMQIAITGCDKNKGNMESSVLIENLQSETLEHRYCTLLFISKQGGDPLPEDGLRSLNRVELDKLSENGKKWLKVHDTSVQEAAFKRFQSSYSPYYPMDVKVLKKYIR